MNLAPVTLEPGETFGNLKVIRRTPSGRYRVGCSCGFSRDIVRANALMRAGGLTKCSRCRKADGLSCKDSSSNS